MTKDIRIRVEVAKQAFTIKFPCPQDGNEIDELMPAIEQAIRELLESELLEN